MATSKMVPLLRQFPTRLPASWLSARSIATSPTLVPPETSTSAASTIESSLPSESLSTVTPLEEPIAESSSPSTSSSLAAPEVPPAKKFTYFVSRTGSTKALPVYSNFKSGGTRKEIHIRHVSGELGDLTKDLKAHFRKLGPVKQNHLTNSLVIKGLDPSVPQIKRWLESQGF